MLNKPPLGNWHKFLFFLAFSPRRGLMSIVLMPLIILITGCFQQRSPELKISIQVEPYGRPGTYKVKGNTNLPDQSKIEVVAIRYLQSVQQPYSNKSASPNTEYSILARQYVEVNRGNWEAKLNLWEVDSEGYFREAWQINESKAEVEYLPKAKVGFLAIVNPNNQSSELWNRLEKQIDSSNNSFIRFAPDGQWYLQQGEILSVPLPRDKTKPPALKAEDLNDGWGDRSQIRTEITNIKNKFIPKSLKSQTNAPLSASEFLR